MGNPEDAGYLLTIVVPLFNEEGNLPRLVKELTEYLSSATFKAKVLFVNDGSTDHSADLIEQYCTMNPAFGYLHLQQNSGLSTALKAGLDHVETLYTGYIDADLQTSPYDFELLMEHSANYDLVTGIRVGRQDGMVKRISSRIANAIRRSVTHDGVSDTGCPLKIVRTAAFRKVPFFKGMHRFLPALILLGDGKVKEVPVRHYKRLAGDSKFHLSNRLIGPATDLIAFAWMRNRYIRYQIKAKG